MCNRNIKIQVCFTIYFFSYMITQIVSPQQYLSYNGSNSRNNSAVTLNRQTSNPTSQSEKSLYVTFFCLTTTFLVCHLPRLIINIYEVPMSSNRQICEEIYQRHYFQPKWVIILSKTTKIGSVKGLLLYFNQVLKGSLFSPSGHNS